MSGPFVRPWVWFVILQDISERRDPSTGWLIDDGARYCEMTFMLPWGHSKTGVACQRWAAYNCRFCSAVFLVIVTLLKDWVELTRVRRMMIGRLNPLRDWKQEKDHYWFPPFWSDLTFDTASSFSKEQSDHQRNVHRWCVVSSYQFTLFSSSGILSFRRRSMFEMYVSVWLFRCVILSFSYYFSPVTCIVFDGKNTNRLVTHTCSKAFLFATEYHPAGSTLLRFRRAGACWTKCFGISITHPRWDFRGPCEWCQTLTTGR